jgi:hypothetical protein
MSPISISGGVPSGSMACSRIAKFACVLVHDQSAAAAELPRQLRASDPPARRVVGLGAAMSPPAVRQLARTIA